MFDCGCNEKLDKTLLDIVKNEAALADYILLSHATCAHVGALAYVNSQGIRPKKVVGTRPVAEIGAQTMHELYIQRKENPEIKQTRDGSSKPKEESFPNFTLQNVEESFEKIDLVSY